MRKLDRFNSLFEMLETTPKKIPGDVMAIFSFNSLFEMPVGYCAARHETCAVSILYLRCFDVLLYEPVVIIWQFQFSI